MDQEAMGKELQRFNVTDAAIEKLKNDYLPLEILGVDDRSGYKAVHEARMEVKGLRIEVEKTGKALRADAVAFQKAVIVEEDRITGKLREIENNLKSKQDAVDAEKARLKAEEEARTAALIQSRVNRLFAYGAKFDGVAYSIFQFSITHAALLIMPDEQFEKYADAIRVEVDADIERREAEEKAKQEEAERLAKIAEEQAAEAKRLADLAAELKRKEDEIAAAEKARVEAEREKIIKARKADLANLGMVFNGEDHYVGHKYQIMQTDLVDLCQGDWDEHLAAIRAAIEAEKVEESKRAAEAERLAKEKEEKRLADLEQAKKDAAEKAIRDQEEKTAADKAEKERLEKLLPERDKLMAFADAIEAVKPPNTKGMSEAGKAIVAEAVVRLTRAADEVRKRTRGMK